MALDPASCRRPGGHGLSVRRHTGGILRQHVLQMETRHVSPAVIDLFCGSGGAGSGEVRYCVGVANLGAVGLAESLARSDPEELAAR